MFDIKVYIVKNSQGGNNPFLSGALSCDGQARIKTFRSTGANTWLWNAINENNSLKSYIPS